jgi:hypothetical protein
MRVRELSMSLGAATLLLALAAPEADAQRGRLGTLRSAPRPSLGGARPRAGVISPHFFNSCFVSPFAFPFFGGFPLVNIDIAANQPAPDPLNHVAPDPTRQPVPFMGSHPAPTMHPAPGLSTIPGATGTTANAAAVPVYAPPVYSPPVYGAVAPVATPQVNNGMVVGDIIDDPTFGLWGGLFFGGGGIVCGPTRMLRGII